MRPRPFLLLLVGVALALMAAGDADAEPDDMVGHWSLDEGEGTTAYDSSGNGNDGTLQNGPQWVDGIDGGALEFDGEDDSVSINSIVSQDSFSRGTVCSWFNSKETWLQNQIRLISFGDGGDDYNDVIIRIYQNKLRVEVGNSNGWDRVISSITTDWEILEWHHICVTWNNIDGELFLYADSTLVGSADSSRTPLISKGRFSGHISDSTHLFNGYIDEVFIWNRTLTSNEISELYEYESYASPASIDSISPNPVKQDYQVYFRGHGEQDDETFIRYAWRSSIDGELHNGTEANFTLAALQLTQGDHTIYFKVQNESGNWSTETNRTLTILPPNQPPTASITSIAPNPVVQGEMLEGTVLDEVIFHEDWENGQGNWIFTNTYNTPVEVSTNYPFSGEYALSVGDTPCNSGCQGYSGTATLTFEAPFPEGEYNLTWWVYENDNQINSGLGYGRIGEVSINGEFVSRFDNYDHYDPNPGWVMYKYTHLGDIASIAFRAWDMPEWGMVMTIDNITISSTEYGPGSSHVTFTGSASDSDGTVAAYEWSSSLDGFLSDLRVFDYDSTLLTVGNHTITFRAQDNNGDWSEYATSWLEVLPDSDGDGIGDNADEFPLDPSETTDGDGDGVGDNGDLFPSDPDEWADGDGDGVGDNGDAFPNNPDEWGDTDGDGVGNNGDAFPETAWLRAWWQLGLILVTLGIATYSASFSFLTRRAFRGTEQALGEWEREGVNTAPVRKLLDEGHRKWGHFNHPGAMALAAQAKEKGEEHAREHGNIKRIFDRVEEKLQGYEAEGVQLGPVRDLLEQARSAWDEMDFQKADELADRAWRKGAELESQYQAAAERVTELRAKIAEFKEKGINTDELERVLEQCEAEMGAGP